MNKNKKKLSKAKKKEQKPDDRAYTLKMVRHHQLQILSLIKKPGFTAQALITLELCFRTLHDNIVEALKNIYAQIEKEAKELDEREAMVKETEGQTGLIHEGNNGEKAA